MCKCVFNQYDCGHESKRGYLNCKTGRPMTNSSSSCGMVNFAPDFVKGPCSTPSCNYRELLAKGWRCCRCNNGPNKKPQCDSDAKPTEWTSHECRHTPCMNCSVWNGQKRKMGEEPYLGPGSGSGGSGNGGSGNGGSAMRKDAGSVRQNLKLNTSGISKYPSSRR